MLILAVAAAAAAPRAARATSEGDAARADIQKTFGFVPGFFKLVPDLALPGAWMDFKGVVVNPMTALPPKMKDLVGLAVAAQIPCEYCIYAHTEFAKMNGATDAEISEAVAMGALTRKWSTFLNGIQTDESKFRSEIGQLVTNMKKMMASGATAAAEADAGDGRARPRSNRSSRASGSRPSFCAATRRRGWRARGPRCATSR